MATAHAKVTGWDITLNTETPGGVDTSTSGWMDREQGFKDWTGTFDYHFVGTGHECALGTEYTWDFYEQDVMVWSGTGRITQRTYTSEINGLQKGQITIGGTGALTPTGSGTSPFTATAEATVKYTIVP